MALETVEYVNDLVQANPASTDPASQGDDHIRNIKKALKQSFAFIAGPVTSSHTELNFVKGVTSAIQTQINNILARVTTAETTIGSLVAGTVMPSRRVNAGTGLSGGGDLTADRTLTVDNTIARVATQITAGDGLSGGGTLAANRSFAVDGTVARTSRSLTAGDGLSGGGSLAADRSFSVDGTVARKNGPETFAGEVTAKGTLWSNPDAGFATVFGRVGIVNAFNIFAGLTNILTIRAFTADGGSFKDMTLNGATGILSADGFSGSGASLTNIAAGNITGTLADARIPTNIVRSTRSVSAGNGLSGGGDLSANRSIDLGTPTAITRGGTNSVTTGSHSHQFTDATFRDYLQANIRDNTVGSLGIYVNTSNTSSSAESGVPATLATLNGTAGTWTRISRTSPILIEAAGTVYMCMGIYVRTA